MVKRLNRDFRDFYITVKGRSVPDFIGNCCIFAVYMLIAFFEGSGSNYWSDQLKVIVGKRKSSGKKPAENRFSTSPGQ